MSPLKIKKPDVLLQIWGTLAVLLFSCCGGQQVGYSYKYQTGPFTVLLEGPAPALLQVRTQSTVVWEAQATSFLSLAAVEESVRQIGGDFAISLRSLQRCDGVEITGNGSQPGPSPGGREGNNLVYFSGQVCGNTSSATTFQLTFQAEDVSDGHAHLLFNVSVVSAVFNQLLLTYGSVQGEHLYGFGSQYSRLDMKGRRLPLFLSEQGVGRGLQPLTAFLDLFSPGAGGDWHTTYTRVPFYVSNLKRGLALESLEYAVFDMRAKDSVTIELLATEMTGRLLTGDSPLDVVQSYTAFAGRMQPLPGWVGSGAILGLQGGTGAVLEAVGQVGRVWGNLSDVAGVWLQDWTGQRSFNGSQDLPRVGLWWNWEVDSMHYPNWTGLVASLQSLGIRTLTYVNCMLSDVSQRGTPYQHNYFKEALEKKYVVRNSDGSVWTGYNGTMVDISNPAAYNWLKDIIVKNMLGTGVCGWMCDFGESVPLNASLSSGQNPRQFHSQYPGLWAQLNADAISTASAQGLLRNNCSEEDVVFFMRAGNALSPGKSRFFWLGDQTVTWDEHDGLATAITGMISGGISGYSLTHSDIGGYTAVHKYFIKYVRSKELFLRWCELSAFTLAYRSHLGTLPSQNWQMNSDNETLVHFFNMTVVFQSWGFYRSDLMNQAHKLGWPVVRHMMLVFPENPSVYTEDLRFQYMLGTQLLVAPVHSRGQEEARVFLPAGLVWVHLWTGTQLLGADEWVEVPAPIGQPCVLYPRGSSVGEQFRLNLKFRGLL